MTNDKIKELLKDRAFLIERRNEYDKKIADVEQAIRVLKARLS